MKTYLGEVCRDGASWSIYIPELRAVTSAKWPMHANRAAQALISGLLDIPLDDVQVMLEVVDR